MKTKFVRENIVVFFVLILISVFGIIFFKNIGYSNFKYIPLEDPQKGLEILGVTIFITLVLERALEMLMNLWRENGKTGLNSTLAGINENIDFFKSKIVELELLKKDNITDHQKVAEYETSIAKIQAEITKEEQSKIPHQKELAAYSIVTKQYAHLTSFFLGIIISLSGFGILNEFFKYAEFEKLASENQAQIEILNSSVIEYKSLDSALLILEKVDSISIIDANNTLIKVENPIKGINTKHLDSLFNDSELQKEIIAINNNNLQHKIFMILNLLITALLISGGTEGMHKLAKLYTTFLAGTTKRIEEADKLKP